MVLEHRYNFQILLNYFSGLNNKVTLQKKIMAVLRKRREQMILILKYYRMLWQIVHYNIKGNLFDLKELFRLDFWLWVASLY